VTDASAGTTDLVTADDVLTAVDAVADARSPRRPLADWDGRPREVPG
jgi:hypothetical protein